MKIFLMFLVILALGLFSISDADGLSCVASAVQDKYDYSDNVFHGLLVSKQHDPDNHSQTEMIFKVHESFKAENPPQITVSFNEGYDKKFDEGREYVVFAKESDMQIKVMLCGIQYHAFPTIVNIVSHLDEPGNDYGHISEYDLYDHISESEKTQLESLSERYAEQRKREQETFNQKILIIGIPASLGIGVMLMWVKKMR